MKYFRSFFVFFLVLIFAQAARATHLRAGEITVRRLNCTSLAFEITITVYTNTGSEIKFGDGILDFGDGTTPHITPTVNNSSPPQLNLPPNVGYVSYSYTHTFGGPGRYVISYVEPNRNAGILNMFNSVETKFYLETVINIDPFYGCDNSPKLLVPPIDKACTGSAWYHNPGAYDPDGDSLSYEFVIPKQAKGQSVNNYRNPNVKEFYDRIGLTYGAANEAKNGAPTFTINSRTGTILWNAPGAPGEYNIAFLVIEWRKFGGTWVKLGSVTRDMQIVVEDCKNKRPELEIPEDICVDAGTTVNESIFGFDPDSDSVKMEAFSEVFSLSSPATWSPSPAKFQASGPNKKAVIKFTWNTKCEHIKEQPYQVVFKISDKPKQGPSLVQFKTWNIKVVAPAPKWSDIKVDLGSRSATLQWKNYACQQAEKMEVWRRVDKFEFTPPECVTGMPDFLGFTKIAEVPIGQAANKQSSYIDTNNGKGLAVGAEYCYRLVAVFPLPGGGQSYVSRDTCLAPILAGAPVITNVTVDKTSVSAGQITVKWRSPFDVSKAQFPPPYTYEVYRAEGFTGTVKRSLAHPGRLSDSTFVDTGIGSGLNTQDIVYNYSVVAYDNTGTKIDTSPTASSVRLELKTRLKEIELNWSFDVPWSNSIKDYPRHLIYRGSQGATEAQMVLIDSIDVNENTFVYVDSGQYKETPLKETETYCYRVMTRGAYGNPKIKEPLVNFSQIICAQPNDSQPPCQPELSVDVTGTGCGDGTDSNSCAPTIFSNTISWKRPADAACRADIRSYKIYYYENSSSKDSILLAENVRDTFYVNSNIPSFARCYRVSAVDRSGNESRLSDKFCFDNCPHYELPNVFTPNGDGCNALFSAYSDREVIKEDGTGDCGPVDVIEQKRKCARFVDRVRFTVVNRWGKEVYTYESGAERTIYIDWDGRDNEGKELSAGVYYYVAEVSFNVVDPSQRNQTLRGWVHLMR